MEIFDFMNDMSPWVWIAIGLGLGIIEMLSFSFFLIWPGLAALAVGVAMWIVPSMTGTMQVLTFAGLSILFTLIGRYFVLSRTPTSEAPGLNNRAVQMIGRTAIVVDGFAGEAMGNVEVDGIRWRARLDHDGPAPAAGEVLRITSASGMTLHVAPRE